MAPVNDTLRRPQIFPSGEPVPREVQNRDLEKEYKTWEWLVPDPRRLRSARCGIMAGGDHDIAHGCRIWAGESKIKSLMAASTCRR